MLLEKRPDWDTYFMLVCHLIATRSTCNRGPDLRFRKDYKGTGSVIVKDNQILATGYNGSPSGIESCDEVGHVMIDGHCRKTLHSEENAILQCSKFGISCEGSTIYSTTELCYECAKKVVQIGIKRIVFEFSYRNPSSNKLYDKKNIEVVQWKPPSHLVF